MNNIQLHSKFLEFNKLYLDPFNKSKYLVGIAMIIFNIGSSSSYDCSKNTSIYCSTKHALLGMSRSFNVELGSYGVRSIFIAPGSMQTPMGKKVKGQVYNTFIDPNEVAILMKHMLDYEKSMFIDELKIKRTVYK